MHEWPLLAVCLLDEPDVLERELDRESWGEVTAVHQLRLRECIGHCEGAVADDLEQRRTGETEQVAGGERVGHGDCRRGHPAVDDELEPAGLLPCTDDEETLAEGFEHRSGRVYGDGGSGDEPAERAAAGGPSAAGHGCIEHCAVLRFGKV